MLSSPDAEEQRNPCQLNTSEPDVQTLPPLHEGCGWIEIPSVAGC